MKSPLTLLLPLLLAILLSACGDSDRDASQAEGAGIGVIEHAAGATPFVAQLSYALRDFSQLDSVHYRIAPRANTHSRPVAVTLERDWLARRNAWNAAGARIAFPVFGLYAGHRNELVVTTRFRDGSRHVAELAITTGAYTGPAAVYNTPVIHQARGVAWPGLDFMLLKNGYTTPVILDSDGLLRWAGAAPGNALSSLFDGDAFYSGDQGTPHLYRIDIDGSITTSALGDPRYIRFHHELARGKTGFLAEVDAREGGVELLESILAEIDSSGKVLKEWDMSKIFRAAMRAGGDDPDNFVRDGVDWFHMNSAIYDARDNALLVSSRENFVVKLDYDSGAIRWLFGDPEKHWYVNYPSLRALALRLVEGKPPIGQHSLSVPANGELLLFNNGYPNLHAPPGTPVGQRRNFSTPSRYAIDDASRSAREVWTWEANRALLSEFCSSAYEGAPGHYLVAYATLADGLEARLVAMDEAGQIAFEYGYPGNECRTAFMVQPLRMDELTLR